VVNSVLPAATRAAGGATAAIDGVIVSWRIVTGSSSVPHQIALRLARGEEGGLVGPRVTLPAAAGTYEYAAQMPVHAGDELGVDLDEVENTALPPVLRSGVSGATSHFWFPRVPPGESRLYQALESTELLMNATIEPDADHDGYGDETQDACPTVVGPAACPGAGTGASGTGASGTGAALVRPDTAIVSGPSGVIHSRNAVFEFRSDPPGASFECKLDKRPFKPCASPRKYKHLGLGSHKFQVRALNAAGTDTIPATRSFKISPGQGGAGGK
jgi:hypothetical protein